MITIEIKDVPYILCVQCGQKGISDLTIRCIDDKWTVINTSSPPGWSVDMAKESGLCGVCHNAWAREKAKMDALEAEKVDAEHPFIPPEPERITRKFQAAPARQASVNPSPTIASGSSRMSSTAPSISVAHSTAQPIPGTANGSSRVIMADQSRKAPPNVSQPIPKGAEQAPRVSAMTTAKAERSNVVPNQGPGTKVLSTQAIAPILGKSPIVPNQAPGTKVLAVQANTKPVITKQRFVAQPSD